MTQLGKSLRYGSLSAITIGFIVCASLLILYVVHFGRADFSSDDTALSLQAESMWRQGSLFPAGWIGNNGDLMLPSGVLLIAPLLEWFPNSYELHAVVGLFSVVLILGTFSLFLLRGNVPLPIVLLAATVLASGLSRISAIMLFLQTTYVWWPSAFFLGATLILLDREKTSKGTIYSRLRIAALATLVFLVVFANPGRAFLMVVFPLYVFDRILALRLDPSLRIGESRLLSRLGVRDSLIIFGLGGGFVLATLGYYALFQAGIVQTVHNSSSLHWKGWPGIVEHSKIFFFGWFNYLGGVREMNAPTGALEDILRLLRLGFAIWLSWVGIAESMRMLRSTDPIRSALAAAFLAAFIPILVLYITFAPLAINFTTTRYFTVPIVMLLAMAAFRVFGASNDLRWLGYPLSILFSVFMILVCAVRFVPATSQPDLGFFDLHDSHASRIASMLEKENLSWGYATWWNAGVVTILSSEKVRVNPIDFRGMNIIAFPYMTQQRNYLPQEHVGETFLLLGTGEATKERVSAMHAIFGEPTRVVQSEDAAVYVYPENISSHICAMGRSMDSPLTGEERQGSVIQAVRNSGGEGAVAESISVTVRNAGTLALAGTGRYPISIGIQLLDDADSTIAPDWVHFPLPCVIQPGEERVFVIELPEVPAESRSAKVGLVQEGVAWFEQWGVAPKTIPFKRLQN